MSKEKKEVAKKHVISPEVERPSPGPGPEPTPDGDEPIPGLGGWDFRQHLKFADVQMEFEGDGYGEREELDRIKHMQDQAPEIIELLQVHFPLLVRAAHEGAMQMRALVENDPRIVPALGRGIVLQEAFACYVEDRHTEIVGLDVERVNMRAQFILEQRAHAKLKSVDEKGKWLVNDTEPVRKFCQQETLSNVFHSESREEKINLFLCIHRDILDQIDRIFLDCPLILKAPRLRWVWRLDLVELYRDVNSSAVWPMRSIVTNSEVSPPEVRGGDATDDETQEG